MRFWFTALVAIFFLVPAQAAEGAAMALPEMARRAELIVRGKVESKSTQRDSRGRIFTEVKLAVREVWKGDPKSQVLRVVLGTGILGEQKISVAGQVTYDVDEEVVGFYLWNERGEAVTLGMASGKIRVEDVNKVAEIRSRVLEALK